jgi:hypothetical protein
MSEHAFTDIVSLVLDLDDRDIYNEVRSQIDLTVTTVVPDSGNLFADKTVQYSSTSDLFPDIHPASTHFNLDPSESKALTIYVEPGDTQITWGDVSAIGVDYVTLAQVAWIPPIVSSDQKSITLTVTNPSASHIMAFIALTATYNYLAVGATSHEETGMQTLLVKATAAESQQKYARRSMTLAWPVGQSQEETAAIATDTLNKKSEPKPRLTGHLQGTTDELIVQMLIRLIGDRITVVSTALAMSQDFYIASIHLEHAVGDVLKADWGLELAGPEPPS